MAHSIKLGDFANHVDSIVERGINIDRIIVDFPSFVGRHPGVQDRDKLNILLDKLYKLIKSEQFSKNGSMTISFTGITQQKFDGWMELEGHKYLEHMPEEDFTAFCVYLQDLRDNSCFIGRRDNWACVKTYKAVGSDFKPNATTPITHIPARFESFRFPESRDLYTIHSFRSPVHHGINEAREDLVWLENHGLSDPEMQNRFVRNVSGNLVNFNLDRHKFHHKAASVQKAGPYITQEVYDAIANTSNADLFSLSKSTHFHLAMWMVERYSNEGETVYNPFMENGEVAASIMISKRNLVGIEYNYGRWQRVRNMHLQLLTLV